MARGSTTRPSWCASIITVDICWPASDLLVLFSLVFPRTPSLDRSAPADAVRPDQDCLVLRGRGPLQHRDLVRCAGARASRRRQVDRQYARREWATAVALAAEPSLTPVLLPSTSFSSGSATGRRASSSASPLSTRRSSSTNSTEVRGIVSFCHRHQADISVVFFFRILQELSSSFLLSPQSFLFLSISFPSFSFSLFPLFLALQTFLSICTSHSRFAWYTYIFPRTRASMVSRVQAFGVERRAHDMRSRRGAAFLSPVLLLSFSSPLPARATPSLFPAAPCHPSRTASRPSSPACLSLPSQTTRGP